MRVLKTVEEHNRERQTIFDELMKPRKSGIACPQCSGEMVQDAACFQSSYTQGTGPTRIVVKCVPCRMQMSVLA